MERGGSSARERTSSAYGRGSRIQGCKGRINFRSSIRVTPGLGLERGEATPALVDHEASFLLGGPALELERFTSSA